MSLFPMMDALLRDRETLYRRAAEGQDLGRLCGNLLLIFVVTSGLYGAAMGAYRCLHPQYYFSDFELSAPGVQPVRGKVAGMEEETLTVYTRGRLPALKQAQVRFNVTRPTEPYAVSSLGEEGGYATIVLAPGSVLREANAWQLPLLVAAKTPFLFLLTLLVCALALYVLNLAFDIRLHFLPAMTTLAFGLAATGVMLAVFVPIAALFSVVTDSYHFMKVLHLLVFTVAGAFGVKVLAEGLTRMAPEGIKGLRTLLCSWLLLYCLVGGQIAWTLKPFLGTPYLPATPPFRVESGNIYVSTFRSMTQVGR